MLEMVPAGEAIACQLISLRRVIDQLELKFSQLAAEFEQTDQQFSHHLSLSTAESGHLLINGVLDPVGGAAVRTVLEPLARNLLGSPRRGCAGEPTTVCCPSATPTPWSSWPRPAGRPTSRSRPRSRP